jgi:hypothetical protein
MVDRKPPEMPAERVTTLERLIVHMQRREPLTEDEKFTLDEVMEHHQDDPLRKLGEIEQGELYRAQYGTHIGGPRRGPRRRDRPDFGREGSFLVKVTRIVNQHVVEVLNPLGETQQYDPQELRHWGISWVSSPSRVIGYRARCLKSGEDFEPKPEDRKWRVEDLMHHHRADHTECGGPGVLVGASGAR